MRTRLRCHIVALALVLMASTSPARAAIDVVGDDERDVFIGTGGLVLPGSFSGSDTRRRHVADCLGCVWRYTVYCAYGADGLCAHAVVTCPLGKIRYRVWFGRTRDTTEVIGSVCWGSGRPVTRHDIDRSIEQRGERGIPALRPGYDPQGGTLVGVPIIVWAGQPAIVRPPALHLSGMTVRLTCSASWLWAWDDGERHWYQVPGAPYPRRDVTHTYRAPGRYRVSVTSRWRATYTVAGLGPFEADGPAVQQRASLQVPVRSGQTLLAPWNR